MSDLQEIYAKECLMSKESIGRDRQRQLGQSKYEGWCPGCGFFAAVNSGEHRGDCTAAAVNVTS